MTGQDDGFWRGARVGVFGGTFDPPHVGHVRMAETARDTLALDGIAFSVAPHPPHKRDADTTARVHRAAMLELALVGRRGLGAARLEDDARPSYTVDLLRTCRERTSADLYFIMGADSLVELATWKDPEVILGMCTLVVFARTGIPVKLPVAGDASLVVFERPLIDVSSSDVRLRIRNGESVEGLIDVAVAAYIERQGLYRHG